ncbi:MAG: hypothetical protein KDA20_06185 [Phycisphaerales bacterium]|nr:hypothetical protein [Phycisphaerales bacterium]
MQGAITEFWVMVTSDKRKSVVLGTLTLVLIVVIGRALVDGGPARASATSSSASRRERIFSGEVSKIVLDTSGELIPVQRPIKTSRNVFQLNPAVFPPPLQTDPSTSLPPNSRTNYADENPENPDRVRAAAEQEAQQQLARLRLRSTVLGNRPLALIEVVSGRSSHRTWARPGDPVGAFTLVRVETRSVVLELNGVEYELLSDPSER